MYAIVKCGGKQLKVKAGDIVKVEKLAEEAGKKVELNEVLLTDDGKDVKVGTPLVEGAKVVASVLEQIRDDKVIVFKKKRRQNYRRKKGHRQYLTVLKVEEISLGGKKAAAPKKEAAATDAKPAAAKKAPAKKAAAKK